MPTATFQSLAIALVMSRLQTETGVRERHADQSSDEPFMSPQSWCTMHMNSKVQHFDHIRDRCIDLLALAAHPGASRLQNRCANTQGFT